MNILMRHMLLAGAMFLATGMSAGAQTVTIVSDHLDIWHDKQQALFTGGVHMVREDFELFCDSLRAFYKSGEEGGGIDHAIAIGQVRMIQGEKKGMADRALIDNRKQIVTLQGHAVMEQVGGRVEGETIVHDMAAKTTEVRKGEKGRVRLRFDDKETQQVKPPVETVMPENAHSGQNGKKAVDAGQSEVGKP